MAGFVLPQAFDAADRENLTARSLATIPEVELSLPN
jgi:hypothetical protein